MLNKDNTMKKTINYLSKKAGNIAISTEQNNVTVHTSRLEFKSLNQQSKIHLIRHFSKLLGNQNNTKLFFEGKPWSKERVIAFIHHEGQKWDKGEQFSVFAVYNRTTQKFIGSLHVYYVPKEYASIGQGHENVAEIAYILDKTAWGKGYGTEIAVVGKKYIKHLVAQAEINSPAHQLNGIVATVHPENEGSRKILEKTLKNFEPEPFVKYGGQPRVLFYNRLSPQAVTKQVENPLPLKVRLKSID